MNKKILVIPDVHTKYEKVERIISKYGKTHKFIFMGDYFDQFNDTPEINHSTAFWLKKTMTEHPDWVYLCGNHDIPYNPQHSVLCNGFSTQKKTLINEVMRIDDWNKLKYFHYENGWYFSHAGITREWFCNPMNDVISPEIIQNRINSADVLLKAGDVNNAIWASDRFRGGTHKKGGIVWNDWRNMDLIPNTKQVVGHTPIQRINAITDNMTNSTILNVDNSSSGIYFSELAEIDENGHHKVIDTSYI